MKNSNSSITADSRHTPRTHHNPSHGASPVSTPQALQTRWVDQINQIALADADAARALMTEVARGETVSTAPRAAQAVFNDLLAHEAYDAFVEVFNAYNALLKSHAEAEGKPFRSTLVLQLPHDWRPRAPAALSEALGRIHAQCVQVRRPMSGHGVEGTAPTPGTTHGDKTRTRNMPVNGAVCQCIVDLLKAGTTELAIHWPLAEPSWVATAITDGQRLQSIVLGAARQNKNATALEKSCYGELTNAAMKCATLWHLGIHQPGLIAPLAFNVRGLQREGPAVQSVSLRLPRDLSLETDIKTFMEVAARFTSLSEISIDGECTESADVLKGILGPLTGHPCLKRVHIAGGAIGCFDTNQLIVLASVIVFARSCPSLTHFTWDAKSVGNVIRHVMEHFRWDPRLFDLVPEIAAALKDPSFKLQVLSLMGFIIPAGAAESLFSALADNTSLQSLNFSGCFMEMLATKILMQALKNNFTLKHIALPHDPAHWFLVAQRLLLGGFAQAARSTALGQARSDFKPMAFGGLATQQVDLWKKTFDDELKRHADAIAEAPQAQLDINRVRALKKTAFPHREVKDEVAADTTTTTKATTATTTTTTTTTGTTSTTGSTPRSPRTRSGPAHS